VIGDRALVEDFAAELDARRRELGLTWDELARRSSVSRTYLRDLAAAREGQGAPSATVVSRIAVALDVRPDYFRLHRARVVLTSREAIDRVYAKLTSTNGNRG
jgi:transcriptional regulator with XRE-family HTH domain